MNGIQGSTGATPIWHHFMERALADTAVETFSPPVNLVTKPITSTGALSCNQATTLRTEFFQAGTEPNADCSGFNLQQLNEYLDQ
jgi:membrane carboxypeptidase/penicillin-binding protein